MSKSKTFKFLASAHELLECNDIHSIDLVSEICADIQERLGTSRDYVSDIVDLLNNNSKVGKALVTQSLGISDEEFIDVVKKGISEGAFKKEGKLLKLIDEPVKKEPEPVKKEPEPVEDEFEMSVEDTDDVDILIDGLPQGDDYLVSNHLRHLVALPQERRVEYLKQVDINDCITKDDIARVTTRGLDYTLVDDIRENGTAKFRKIKEPITDIGDESSKQGMKYAELIKVWFKHIGDDAEQLYEHMTRNGVDKRVLHDIKTIALAYKKGDL